MNPINVKPNMKKYLCIYLLSIFVIQSFGQITSDSMAIVQLLDKEATSWRMGDIKAHADCWQIRTYNRIWVTPIGGSTIDIPPAIILNPSPDITGKGGIAVLSNFKMNIYNDNAWVSHDEVSIGINGKESYTHEMRFLEKVNTQWKLVGQSNIGYRPENMLHDTTSYIHILDITSGRIETILTVNKHVEAPNWHAGNYLILNSYGKLFTLDISTKKTTLLNTGNVTSVNNDHGISPDNKWLAVSNNDQRGTSLEGYSSVIYILPVAGGEPKKVTSGRMSFWHGWSPDGKTLAFVGYQEGNFDIYTIGTEGGKEKRLTDTEGLDDGPDYSADGKFIYFNSYRTGHMQIWRMHADGSDSEQLTFDEHSNWFAHPSPDNRWIAYLSYVDDEKQNHLFGKSVRLRLMNLETKEIKDITPVFYGGQGTFNVPSWSPDSKKIAFVSYSVK
jgi:Tol biopolymer transport system component